jgi:hypothetical protein
VEYKGQSSARVLVQRENEGKCLAEGKEDSALRAGMRIYRSDVFLLDVLGGTDVAPPLIDHRPR